MTRTRLASLALAVLLGASGVFAWTIAGAQEDDSAEKGRFTRFVEDTISTPDRRISIGSIQGVLSSDVRIDTITVSDRDGVWLTVNGAHLVWSRLALLRGRLDVDLLEAESIVVTRPPLPAETVDPAAGGGFGLPELPVEVVIDKLAVPTVALPAAIVGDDATLSVDGAISLQGGTLDSNLAIERTDEKPGTLALAAEFVGDTRQLTLDLKLQEPENGVVSNLLGIPDRPAIAFAIAGAGPLEAFAADISLDAAGQRLVAGRATISEVAGGYRFVTDVNGNLAPLVPPEYGDYVRGSSRLAIDATRAADGSIAIGEASITSGVAAVRFAGDFAPDGFPTRLDVSGTLAEESGRPVALPGAAGTGTVGEARFQVAFGGTADRWSASFDLAGLDTGNVAAGRATIRAEGAAVNLREPGARRLDFTVDGDLTQLTADDPNLARALGERFDILARGSWVSGQPVQVEVAEIKNPNAATHFRGRIDGLDAIGRFTLNAANIAPFAGLLNQPIAGAVTLAAEGTVGLGTGALALDIDANTVDLTLQNPTVDPLLAGETTLRGRAERDAEGLRFADLRVENPRLSARLDGVYDLDRADLGLTARLADVAVLTDRARGAIALDARLSGSGTRPDVTATVTAADLALQDRRLTGAEARFTGTLAGSAVDGTLAVTGSLDRVPLRLDARIASLEDGTRRLDDLSLTAGETRATGGLALLPSGLLDGGITVTSPDVSVVAPLVLVDAGGAVDADLRLTPENSTQTAAVKATVRGLRVETTTIGTADVDLTARDAFGVPEVDGTVNATRIVAGGVTVDALAATARLEGSTTRFDATADLAAGRIATAGALTPVENGFDLALDRLDAVREPNLRAALAAPVTIGIRGSDVTIPDATLTIGSGRITVAGTVAETIDLRAVVDRLPLDIANAVAPDLALAGTVTGQLTATGTRSDPRAAFDVRGEAVTAAPLRAAGLRPLGITASGTHAGGTTDLRAETTIEGGRVTVAGTVGETLALDATVRALPAALANAASRGLGAAGTIDATARVAGTPAAPVVDFDVTGRGLTVAAAREAGVPPLALSAEGRFEDRRVTVDATATGGALSLRANGTVPLAGPGLSIALSGSVPLSLADRPLATRGTRVTGTARIEARVTGSLAAPVVAGDISADGASVVDPETTTRITGISARISLDGQRATIARLSGSTAGGGTLSVTGSVGIAPGSGFPADLAISFDNARLSDGNIVTAQANGSLRLSGPLTGALAVAGTVDILRAEITVPESLPRTATLLDVRHRLPPPNVQRTLERANLATQGRADGAGASGGITLDITVNAPARVFVRGRGIDAELGGSVRVTGPIASVSPVGSLTLRRGRLDVVGQRVTFDRGSVTLVGDLDPYIDLVASLRNNNITVTVSVTGTASDPSIALSSVPELPQDEILAQFLFGKSITDLSPLQIARLTAAVAQLAGGAGGPDLLGSIRKSTGLDDLDVTTDSEGNAAVQAGRYISENVYLGVTAGANGQANVSVNLDITDEVKARGEVGPTGGSKVGVFFEREY